MRDAMILGVVNAHREAMIRFSVLAASGQEYEIEAILDTGCNGSLTLPPVVIAELALPWRTRSRITLANGSDDICDIYAATALWDGGPRSILVEAADTAPLVGMALLYGHDVRLQVITGGSVSITALS